MPASSGEVIGVALHSVYRHHQHTAAHTHKQQNSLQEQLSVCAKQVLQNTVEYEHTGSQQSLILDGLKSKYVSLTSTPTTTTTTQQPMAHGIPKHPQGNKDDQLEDPHVVLWPRDKVTLGWRKSFPPGAGMVNLGNTCYLNSSLQALFHIPALANWLLEELQSHTQRCETNTVNASFCSVCAMMYTLRATLDRSSNVIKPSLIQNKLKSIGKTLMYGRQEDAHEFIKLLLDHMEKSYLAFRRATKLDHRSKETTPLNQIFGGYLRQQVICPLCRYVSTTFNHFQDLVLDIRSVSSVDDALNLHFRKETLDSENAYRCERCHKKVPATKRHLIERPPHVLLIQLKRFTISGGKIGKHINIQRTIDLTRFINNTHKQAAGCGASSGPYQYRLASMVIHLGGSQHGGHYTAIAESSGGNMFEFDDSSVRSISLQSALLRNPYILFYEMIRRPKDPSGIKQVVRQSSDKVLIKSSDTITKPLPTSHSASSVNGFPHPLNESAGGGGKGPIAPPLPCHKERERLSFALKTHTKPSSDSSPSKPSKLIIHSSTSLLAKTNTHTAKPNLGTSAKGTGVKTASAPSTTQPKPQPKVNIKQVTKGSVSSLVPYLDDTDDSDDGKDSKRARNAKGDKSGSGLPSQVSNGNATMADAQKPKAMIPRSLQIVSGGVRAKVESGWQVTDAALHSPSEGSGCSVGSAGGRPFTVVDQATGPRSDADSKGWIVTLVGKERKAETDRRQCEKAPENRTNEAKKIETGNEAVKRTKDPDAKPDETESKPVPEQRPKDALERGLMHAKLNQESERKVQERKPKPELEKSLSNDCVLPSHRKDLDTASLKSKNSVNSTKSDQSNKTKRSIFSIFNCVSAHSPESPTVPVETKRGRDEEAEPSSPSSPSKKSCQDTVQDGRKKSAPQDHSTVHQTTSTTTSKNGVRAQDRDSKNSHRVADMPKDPPTTTNHNGTNKYASSSSTSSSSLSESDEEDRWVERTKETIGEMKAKQHSSPNIVHWNEPGSKGRKGLWEGSKNSSVVDELRRAGNKAYGTEVSSWNGGQSHADQEFENARREAKKRSADDLYNEEMDAGRSKKVKNKKATGGWGDSTTSSNSNPFQRFQDTKYNTSSSSSSNTPTAAPTSTPHYGYNQHRPNYYSSYHHHHRYSNWDRSRHSWGQNRKQKFHNKRYREKYKH